MYGRFLESMALDSQSLIQQTCRNPLAFAPHERVAFSAFWPLTQPSVHFFLIAPIFARPEIVKSLRREAGKGRFPASAVL